MYHDSWIIYSKVVPERIKKNEHSIGVYWKNNNKNNNNSKQQTCVFCARSRKKQRKEEEEEERNGICFEERETEFLYSMKEVKTTRKKNSNKSVNNLEYTIHTVLKLEGTAERTEKARVHVSTLCYLLIDEHTHTRKGLDRPKVDEMVDASFFVVHLVVVVIIFIAIINATIVLFVIHTTG